VWGWLVVLPTSCFFEIVASTSLSHQNKFRIVNLNNRDMSIAEKCIYGLLFVTVLGWIISEAAIFAKDFLNYLYNHKDA
jgi:hypothetical protein